VTWGVTIWPFWLGFGDGRMGRLNGFESDIIIDNRSIHIGVVC
jgi:hypothetical protein